jgi:hypothetical protein
MPRSNKRRDGLPNPCPIGLQSYSSIQLALHPSGCTRPQPHAGPTHGGIPPLRPHRIQAPLWYLPLSHKGPQPRARPTPCWDTHPLAMPWHGHLLGPPPLGSPPPSHSGPQHRASPTTHRDTCPLSSMSFRPCWAPAGGMTGPLPFGLPVLQDLLGSRTGDFLNLFIFFCFSLL